MRNSLILSLIILFGAHTYAQPGHGRLVVSPNGHYLQYEDGTPFFWLADTGWELFHRLDLDEITVYLDNRAAKGFTVVQAVALAEMDGLRVANPYGVLPFKNFDPAFPNEKYFAVIDSTIHMARARNIFVGLLPTWGDKVVPGNGAGPVIFDSVNAYKYGYWLGNRYRDDTNLIWILGGDRPALRDTSDWRPVWRQMAQGIIDATNDKCIITYHPSGGKNSSSQWLHQEPWLDVNMFQSGHGDGHDVACWELIKRDRSYSPPKPTLDGEPNYEDHPVNPWPKWKVENGYFRDYDVRKQLYRSVFAGGAGVTYGHHSIWQFFNAKVAIINHADRGWLNALDRPGAYQAGYLKRLMESRPLLSRIPDSSIVVGGLGEKAEHLEAFRDAENTYTMIYLPVGKKITVNLSFMNAENITAWWFNPKNASVVKTGTIKKTSTIEFTPPVTGIENDWVLIIDDASKNYKEPGK